MFMSICYILCIIFVAQCIILAASRSIVKPIDKPMLFFLSVFYFTSYLSIFLLLGVKALLTLAAYNSTIISTRSKVTIDH